MTFKSSFNTFIYIIAMTMLDKVSRFFVKNLNKMSKFLFTSISIIFNQF